MRSFGTVLGKNIYYTNNCFCTSSWYLRLYLIFNVFAVVLCWYTNALYLDDSVANVVQCADPKCKGVVAYAETHGSYPSRDRRILSFQPGMKVTIYAKPAYDMMKLVFGEINGKKGYIPLNMIRETKVVARNLVPVVLPKGISNIVEDNSDDNSDKSTAGVLSVPESIGSTVNQDFITPPPPTDHESVTEPVESQKSPIEQDAVTKQESLSSQHSEEKNLNLTFMNDSKSVTTDNTTKVDSNETRRRSMGEETNVGLDKLGDTPKDNVAHSNDLSKSNDLKHVEKLEPNVTLSDEKEKYETETSNNLSVEEKVNDSSNQNIADSPVAEIVSNADSSSAELSKDEGSVNIHSEAKNKLNDKLETGEDTASDRSDQMGEKSTDDNVDMGTAVTSESDHNSAIKDEKRTQSHLIVPSEIKGENSEFTNETELISDTKRNHTEDAQSINEQQTNSTINPQDVVADDPALQKSEDVSELNAVASKSETEETHEKTLSVANNESNVENVTSRGTSKANKSDELNVVENSELVNEVNNSNVNNSASKDSQQENVDSSVKVDSENVTSETEKVTEMDLSSSTLQDNENNIRDSTGFRTTSDEISAIKDNNIVAEGVSNAFSPVEGDSITEKITRESEQVHSLHNEDVLGSETRESSHIKNKVNLTSVDSESTSKLVGEDEVETLRPESVLPIRNHYDDSTTSASILFTIIPREYIDILRIYVTIFSDMLPDNLKIILASLRISSHVVVLTFLCGALWLTMYFIGALFNLFNKDSSLRAQLCDFEVKFFKMKNERDSLRRLLQAEEEKCFEFDEKISEREQKISYLERELDRVKKERVELQEKVIALEADVTRATDAGLEMNAVLSDFLTSQKENVSLNSKVESLQQQITKQEEFISQLRKSYRSTKEENAELTHINEKATAELERLTRLLDDTDANLKKFQSNNEALKSSNNEMLQQLKELDESKTSLIYELRKLEEEKEERDALIRKLEEEISASNSVFESKSSEIKSLQEVIRSLKEDTEDNVDDLFDVAKVKTELDVLRKQKSDIELKYEDIISEREKLLQTVKGLEESNATCKENEEKAMKEKIDAQNNLEILKNYFVAKEAELQQKVGTLQVSKQQREEDANSLVDRLKFLEEENNAYKSQLETMKKELIDSDKNWKAQLAKMEKKAHENWVAARNSHRELEALKSDSAALRQHLSMKAKSTVDGDSSLDDDEPVSIPSYMPPPPPFPAFPPFGDDKGDVRRWDAAANFTSPPPPPPMPIPPFAMDFENMPPMPQSFNSLTSHHHSLPHPMQWDSPSSRDAFSPISQQSHERRSSRGNSPMHSTMSGSSSMRGTMPPVPNFASFNSHPMYANSAQFTNPPPHWTRPNGNLTNNSMNKQNHEKKKSRSDSRSSMSNASLHASNV